MLREISAQEALYNITLWIILTLKLYNLKRQPLLLSVIDEEGAESSRD